MSAALAMVAIWVAAIPARPRPRRVPAIAGPGVPVLLGAALRRPFSAVIAKPADRVVGLAAIVALPLMLLDLRLGPVAGFGVWIQDLARRRREAGERSLAISRELPEIVDLFALALAGGGSIHSALGLVARRPIGPLSHRLAEADTAVRQGGRLADELQLALTDIGPQARPLIRALTGAEHYGTSIDHTLERIADEARHTRRRTAEARARRAPVRLLGPLVLCVLPAFVLLTVVPTVARTLQGLSLTPAP